MLVKVDKFDWLAVIVIALLLNCNKKELVEVLTLLLHHV